MGKPLRLLIVEDSEDDALLVIRELERGGYDTTFERVETVEAMTAALEKQAWDIIIADYKMPHFSAPEALDYLFATGTYADRDTNVMPTLVILDLKLPKVDGLEVLQRMRADERTKLTPVVVLTSSKEERDMVNSYRFGANSYVQKPVDFTQFIEAARQLGLYWLVINEPPPRLRRT